MKSSGWEHFHLTLLHKEGSLVLQAPEESYQPELTDPTPQPMFPTQAKFMLW